LGENECDAGDGFKAGEEPVSRADAVLRAFGERVGLVPAAPMAPEAAPAEAQPQPIPPSAAGVPLTLKQIAERVMGTFEGSQSLGVHPRGWLPPEPERIPHESVVAELRRALPVLNQHGWPQEARQRLLARIQPGDRIVSVTDDFLLVSARPPRECYRIWRDDA
jgi:hypothetical protein